MGRPLNNQDAVSYGEFVQAAYTMFRNPGPDPLRPAPQGIPDGWELGAWVHMSDFIFNIVEPKFYGIIAHKTNDVHTRVIAIRGTEGAIEWLDDGFAIPVPFHQAPNAGRVACGFDKIYTTMKVVPRPLPREREARAAAVPEALEGSFAEQLEKLALMREVTFGAKAMTPQGRPERPTVVTGHSLGGALTTLFVMENAAKKKFDISMLCTFASPRVGNAEFAKTFDQLPIDSWRIFNQPDLVPKLPPHVPIVLDYDHVNVGYPFDSRNCAKHTLLCFHCMETYLHLLDENKQLLAQCKP